VEEVLSQLKKDLRKKSRRSKLIDEKIFKGLSKKKSTSGEPKKVKKS
jgi:hypothetical protein